MSSEPICAYVYINGETLYSSSLGTNAFFRSDKTKSLLLNPTMTLGDIRNSIQASIRDDDVTSVITALWYRCPIYENNGSVVYRAIRIIDEEGVRCMFHTFAQMASVICMELKVDVHNSSLPSQINDISYAEMEQKLDNSLKLE